MNTNKRRLWLVALSAFTLTAIASRGWTKVEYDSNQLMIKNADQISELVRKKIKKAQEIQNKQESNDDGSFVPEPEAVEQLVDALRIVLARPDQDGTRANAFSRLRRELVDLNSLDTSLGELTKESIAAMKDGKTPPRRLSTYIVVLENLMAEIKPEIKTNAPFKKLIEDIRDAKIEIPESLKSQQLLRSMSKPVSPSETAASILAKDAEKKDEKKAEKKK